MNLYKRGGVERYNWKGDEEGGSLRLSAEVGKVSGRGFSQIDPGAKVKRGREREAQRGISSLVLSVGQK